MFTSTIVSPRTAALTLHFALVGGALAWTDYYSFSNPGTARPPNSPWTAVSGTITVPAGGSVWIATSNAYVQQNQKAYTLTVTGVGGQGFVSLLSSSNANGYYIVNGVVHTSSIISATSDQYSVGPPPTLTCKRTYQPQPDWEVMKLTSSMATGSHKINVSGSSICSLYGTSGSMRWEDGWCGPSGGAFRYTTAFVFPEDVALDLSVPPLLITPESGSWTWTVTTSDPLGQPHPFPGIRWECVGPGLTASQPFHLEFATLGPADTRYSLILFDATTQRHVPFDMGAQAPMSMKGDMNCDGLVDFFDIDALVLALSGQAAYQAVFPDCDWMNADCNEDGSVDFFDIDPFVALIGTGPQ